MIQAFSQYKKRIDSFLVAYLHGQKQSFTNISSWGDDILIRLILFIPKGKTLRGSLILFISEALGFPVNESMLHLAASLELTHAGFLIHDDIMDNDTLRRGHATVTEQYKNLGKQKGYRNPKHFGLSMGICAADLCYFLGAELLTKSQLQTREKTGISALVAEEFSYVCLAQMSDVSAGYSNQEQKSLDILNMYRYKTARYTFSLPLMIGAIVCKQSETLVGHLEKLGETMGLLYQLRDDELSVSGDPSITGKPKGGDETERKKTFRAVFLQNSSEHDYQAMCEEYLKRSIHSIQSLPIANDKKNIFLDFVSYIGKRQS